LLFGKGGKEKAFRSLSVEKLSGFTVLSGKSLLNTKYAKEKNLYI